MREAVLIPYRHGYVAVAWSCLQHFHQVSHIPSYLHNTDPFIKLGVAWTRVPLHQLYLHF